MAINKAKKEEIVQNIENKAKDAKSGVFIAFKGTSVPKMEELRKTLRQENSSMNVAKKTLIKLGLKNAGLDVDDMPDLEGEVALAFSSDEITAAKVINKFIKEKKVFNVLGGFMEDKFLSAAEIIALGKLPSKQQLIGQFVGTIAAPVQNFVCALNDVNGRFVRVLSAIAEK